MPQYLLQATYTPEAWAAMVKSPQNRLEAVRPVVQKLGGKIEGGWLSFGEYDIAVICELPNNVSAAAFSMAASAGGAMKAVKTTPLMSIEEAMEAMRKAGGAGYRPPTH
ncbi:MAG: GYD domain-containing protein [Candidatus Rokuibacteriota bacterium]